MPDIEVLAQQVIELKEEIAYRKEAEAALLREKEALEHINEHLERSIANANKLAFEAEFANLSPDSKY